MASVRLAAGSSAVSLFAFEQLLAPVLKLDAEPASGAAPKQRESIHHVDE
jgi:hypothetical protein